MAVLCRHPGIPLHQALQSAHTRRIPVCAAKKKGPQKGEGGEGCRPPVTHLNSGRVLHFACGACAHGADSACDENENEPPIIQRGWPV